MLPSDDSEDVEEERKGPWAGMAYFFSAGTGGPVQPLRSVREAPTQTGEHSGCTRPIDQGNLFSNPHEKGKGQEALKSIHAQNLAGGTERRGRFPACAQEHDLPIISQNLGFI